MFTNDQDENIPTEANIDIRGAMYGLVEGAQPDDSLFFYFKGGDGRIAGLYTVKDDFDVITQTMHEIIDQNLPRGCRLTSVLDCCHSGTPFDLPYTYDSHGMLKPSRQDTARRKTSDADVVCLSACKDSGRASVPEDGALGRAFIEYMSKWGNHGTYLDLIQSIRAYMTAGGFGKRLLLSSSHPIDTSQLFSLTYTDQLPQMFPLAPRYEDQDVDNPAGRATRTEMDNDLIIKYLAQPDS